MPFKIITLGDLVADLIVPIRQLPHQALECVNGKLEVDVHAQRHIV